MVDPLDLQDADEWIKEAGRLGGGLAAEFEAVQGVIAAQTLRYQWLGEGNISELYPWYIEHLLRIYNTAQKLVPRGDWMSVPFHLESRKPYDYAVLVMRIRAIFVTLPEVHSGEEDERYIIVSPKLEAEKSFAAMQEERTDILDLSIPVFFTDERWKQCKPDDRYMSDTLVARVRSQLYGTPDIRRLHGESFVSTVGDVVNLGRGGILRRKNIGPNAVECIALMLRSEGVILSD